MLAGRAQAPCVRTRRRRPWRRRGCAASVLSVRSGLRRDPACWRSAGRPFPAAARPRLPTARPAIAEPITDPSARVCPRAGLRAPACARRLARAGDRCVRVCTGHVRVAPCSLSLPMVVSQRRGPAEAEGERRRRRRERRRGSEPREDEREGREVSRVKTREGGEVSRVKTREKDAEPRGRQRKKRARRAEDDVTLSTRTPRDRDPHARS